MRGVRGGIMLVFTALSAEAHADWPSATEVLSVVGGAGPMGISMRNWGPVYQVYVAVERRDDASDFNYAKYYKYTCTVGDGCATSTLLSGYPLSVGEHLEGQDSLQLAMGVSHPSPSDPITLKFALRQKYDADCDDDGDYVEPVEEALDLVAYTWDSVTNVVDAGVPISSNVGNTTNDACADRGVSSLQAAGPFHACYTYKTDAVGTLDRVRCNDDGGGTWDTEQEMTSPGGREDHPAFAFKDGSEVVIGSNRPNTVNDGNDDQVVLHFPEVSAPPLEPTVGINVGGDTVSYPDLLSAGAVNGDILYATYEGDGGYTIKLSRCPNTATCQNASDWTTTDAYTNTTMFVKYPQMVNDGAKQFMVFQRDDDTTNSWGDRVYVIERCGTGAWSAPELVRTPDDGVRDSQYIEYGSPNIAINRVDNVVHVAFVEINTLPAGSEAWWARKAYTDCP